MTLSNALGSGDTKTISGSLDKLSSNLSTISSAQTKEGATTNKLTLTSSSITDTKTNLTSYKSDLADVDLSSVLTSLVQAQTALEATYKVTSSMSDMTLLNYMQ
jgi:flagellar hook-associated protein 3 FlgL